MNRKGFASILIVLIIVAVLALGGGALYVAKKKIAPPVATTPSAPPPATASSSNPGVACTQEAKLCPDGSAVARTGPNCEFAACPTAKATSTQDVTAGWKTYRNEKYGFEVKYPAGWFSGEHDYGSSLQYNLGNPIDGMSTYALNITVDNDSAFKNLPTGEDNATKFSATSKIHFGSVDCDLTTNTFGGDESLDRVLCVNGGYHYEIYFPSAEINKNNPGVSDSVQNNKIAYQILSTFRFMK